MFERLFHLRNNQTTFGTEVRAGVTTFMAMAYIIFTNPAILAAGNVPFTGAVVATCVAAGIVTIMMGLATNYPMCLAAGMGLNAIVAFNIVLGMGKSWQTAMGVVVLEGLVVLVLSAMTIREAVMDAIPQPLKHAIAVAIGILITFVGLQEGNLLETNPATMVSFGDFAHPVALLAMLGLLATGWMVLKGVRGALLLGICITALAGMLPIWHLPAGVGTPAELISGLGEEARWAPLIPLPAKIFQIPSDRASWSTFFAFDLKGAITISLLPVAFAFFMSDFFDTMGTAIGVGAKAGYLDKNGRIPRIRPLLIVDSLGAVIGGAFGCSSNTCFIESTAGVVEGGRTGLTAVVCGCLFLLAVLFTPLIAVIGGGVQVAPMTVRHPVTAAALIIVGFLMMESIVHIDWKKGDEALPAFLVIVTMPLTFSITHGVGMGFITYTFWKVMTGRARDIKPFMWAVAILFVLVFLRPAIEKWLVG